MELMRFPSHGGFSVRSILTFVLTVIITALLWATFSGHTTYAADARWGGDTIIYNDLGFSQDAGFQDTTNTIPAGATVYKTPVQSTGTGSNIEQKVFIIYFTSGVDPPTATTAQYVEFDSKDGKLSNPQNKQSISLTEKSEQDNESSCAVDGVGWIVCPLSNFLAGAMDWLFDWISSAIETQPLILGDSSNSMYIAWNIMRTIANIAFVIAFLIIIYSQLTSMGVSNYGLKKLIPRLIVAAVLVNVSFYIAAVAVDISNILGYSIQDIFVGIREGVFNITEENAGVLGAGNNAWAVVTGVVLAGGGLVGGAWYMAAGGYYLIVPILIGLIATAMLVVLILAARQAIILILIIIAPLAFVANLLPNTEKWFDKWKDLFMTMLIFFPAFSLVFGGSQLAGQLIIQNASNQGGANNIVMIIFGLAVQVAPLVITPLLLKLSGGLLGRIAQIANNPRKGAIDRSRNWAGRRSELAKQRSIAGDRRFNKLGAAMVRKSDFRKRRLDDKTEMYKQAGSNRYSETEGHEKIHEQMHGVQLEKEAIENRHKAHLAEKATITGSELNIRTIDLEDAKVSSERADAQRAHMISGYRAGAYNTESNEHLENMQRRMARNVIETAAWKQGEEAHRYIQQRNISDSIRNNRNQFEISDDAHDLRVKESRTLLDTASGYGDISGAGRDRAQATADATLTKLNKDARDNAIALIETEAVEHQSTIPSYAGSIFAQAKTGDVSITRTRLEAALEIAAREGLVGMFEEARASKVIDQELLDAVVARHVPEMKSKGGFHIQMSPNLSLQRYIESFSKMGTAEEKDLDKDIRKSLASAKSVEDVERAFEKDMNHARLMTLSNTNASNLGGVKASTFAALYKGINKGDYLDSVDLNDADDKAMMERIFKTLRLAIKDDSTAATMTDRLAYVREMEEHIRGEFFRDQAPLDLSEPERAKAGGGTRPASIAENDALPVQDDVPIEGSPNDDQGQ